jgi:hypothetical protein
LFTEKIWGSEEVEKINLGMRRMIKSGNIRNCKLWNMKKTGRIADCSKFRRTVYDFYKPIQSGLGKGTRDFLPDFWRFSSRFLKMGTS